MDSGINKFTGVIGIGGVGINAVKYMVNKTCFVRYLCVDTDPKVIDMIKNTILLKSKFPKGSNILTDKFELEIDDLNNINELIIKSKRKRIFLLAGMGGSVGSICTPLIAKKLKEMNTKVVGIVTIPFKYEGEERKEIADNNILELRKNVDSLIIISNDKLREIYGSLPFEEAFSKANEIMKNIVDRSTCNFGDCEDFEFEDFKDLIENSGIPPALGNGNVEIITEWTFY